MKILHIITSLGNGGAEGVLYRLITNDVENEHLVISLRDEDKYGPLLVEKGIAVECLNMKPDKPSLKSVLTLYHAIKKAKPDIVQTWMYHADLLGGIVAKAAGIKKVYWNIRHSDFNTQHTKSSTIKVAKACALISNIIPNKIISCSQVGLIAHSKMGYKSEKIEVIGNGYDLNALRINSRARQKVREELGIGKYPVLGMVGRYDPQKNHKGLIKALHIVSNKGYKFDLLLVGKGLNKHNSELYHIIQSYNLENNIHLLDQRTDIPDIMNALDIHILSSSYGEGFPNVIAEAMACGTPCIATDIGDSSVIVNRFGKIVNPNNSKNLANAIIEYIEKLENSPESWLNLREEGSKFIKSNFSIQSMVSKYNTIWQT
ncbi:glycosyltransferase [Psychrobacter sanguinis]|uniref:glycosyltransferase n=1 Tax=Psychrobacter sanguinis TaxID=861445 RepID=UPI00191B773F|nr:glycosyltransferase [Psychrobacter sanguinis]MCC3308773.1 glycosyltransferase [Psychrobacter sanguinis]